MALTSQGQILGTLLYMSPEQLQGKEADARSDIFSFGCVLYEMLTGKRAFDGSSPASVIAAILERPAPSVAEVAPNGARPRVEAVSRQRSRESVAKRAGLEIGAGTGGGSCGRCPYRSVTVADRFGFPGVSRTIGRDRVRAGLHRI